MRLFPLEPAMMRYPWGSPIAIPALFGWSSDGQPVAELWYGDHPRAPATAFDERGPRSLDELIAATPELGGALGFLFKLLGAAAPLSLQCHPDDEQARHGFAARRFGDSRGKAELLVALGRFEALEGLRAADDVRAQVAALGVRALDALLPASDAEVGGFVAALLRLDGGRRDAALAEARDGAARASGPVAEWVGRLLERYPADPAALAPLFLHHVELAAGDALFLAPRRLHAYLGGVALELASPSDNVVRGGLTSKPVDVGALLEVADLRPSPPSRLDAAREPGVARYAPDGAPLWLELVEVATAGERPARRGAQVVLGLSGYVVIEQDGEDVELGAGDALLVAPGSPLRLGGQGRLAIAGDG